LPSPCCSHAAQAYMSPTAHSIQQVELSCVPQAQQLLTYCLSAVLAHWPDLPRPNQLPAGMTAGSMYGTMTSAFSASRNARTSESVLGEGSNPMQSLDMGSKRQSAAGALD
jgi:hypothetical protein